jgi:uncharacterized LabA/DUF88 family protein
VPDRAVLFIDGNNWYHGLRDARVYDLARLDYSKIARKLVGPRTWTATRYYIGQMQQIGNTERYAEQRRFLSRLKNADPLMMSVHLGRLEYRAEKSDAAHELLHYLSSLSTKIDNQVYKDLVALGQRHKVAKVMVEKAVDVMLAVDLVVMALRDEFDAAYVLSADGDYTHAVKVARAHGKKVFAVSASHGAQLAAAVDTFIPVKPAWFADCYY